MELRHLRYFVMVAEEMNFGRAAERLHMAQPPLSQQIHDLEQEIGVQLFDRTRRQINLTTGGKTFLAEAQQILAQVEQAVYLARQAQNEQMRVLSIAFTGAAITGLLPEVLQVYQQRFPPIELRLAEMGLVEQLEALHKRQIDLSFALSPGALVTPQITVEKLAECEMLAILPETHRLAQVERLSLTELSQEKWIWFPRQLNPTYHDRLLQRCQQAGFIPQIVQETNQPHIMLGLVAAGIGVALTSSWTQSLTRPGIVYKPLVEKDWQMELYMLCYKGVEDSSEKLALKQFLTLVRELLAE